MGGPEMKMKTLPYQHQRQALDFALSKKRVGLFMDMGTGKTWVAIAWAVRLRLRRVLVICRKDDIYTWKQEIRKHSHAKVRNLMQARAVISLKQFNLITYDQMRMVTSRKERHRDHWTKQIREVRWDAVICDESTRIKHHTAQRTKAIIQVFRDVPYKMIMSGLPITNSLMDIFSQFDFLCDGHCFGTNFYAFRARHFRNFGFVWVPHPSTKKQIIGKMADHGIRITKNECLDLPSKVYQTIKVSMVPKQRQVYERLREKFEIQLRSGEIVDINHAIAQFTKLLCIAGGFYYHNDKSHFVGSRKLFALRDLLQLEELQKKPKIVIWAAFNKEIHLISKLLTELKIKHVLYWKHTINRIQVRREFQRNPHVRVFVGQIRSGIGMNELTVADTVVYYSRSLSLEHRLQSEDRTHRIGSEAHKSITYVDLVVKKSVDSRVYRLLRKHKDVAEAISRALIHRKQSGIFS